MALRLWVVGGEDADVFAGHGLHQWGNAVRVGHAQTEAMRHADLALHAMRAGAGAGDDFFQREGTKFAESSELISRAAPPTQGLRRSGGGKAGDGDASEQGGFDKHGQSLLRARLLPVWCRDLRADDDGCNRPANTVRIARHLGNTFVNNIFNRSSAT